MSRDTERQILEWLQANEPRLIGYSISIGCAWSVLRAYLAVVHKGEYPLSLGQFRRVALYAHTTGYLKEWRGTPPAMKADLPGQSFFEFVAA